MGLQLARVAGPLVAAAIIPTFGVTGAFLLAAIALSLFLPVLWYWRADAVAVRRDSAPPDDGFRFAKIELPRLLVASFSFCLIAGAIPVALPLVAERFSVGGPAGYGLLFACYGFGGVLGPHLGVAIRRRLGSTFPSKFAILTLGGSALVIAMSQSETTLVLATTLAGVGWIIGQGHFNISVQLGTDRSRIGKSVAWLQIASFGGVAIGGVLAATILQINDVSIVLVAVAALALVCLAIDFWASSAAAETRG